MAKEAVEEDECSKDLPGNDQREEDEWCANNLDNTVRPRSRESCLVNSTYVEEL